MTQDGRIQVLLVGIGGQGILTATTILTEAAHQAGLQVVAGQLHGMSQRGGSVECSVAIGEASSSFVVGAPDLVIAFEPLELLRCAHRLDESTTALVNTTRIMPPGVDAHGSAYPSTDEIVVRVGATGAHVIVIDGPRLIREVGESRTLNMLMLGAAAASGLLPLSPEQLRVALRERCPPRWLSANEAAFELGFEAMVAQQPERQTNLRGARA